MNDQIDIKLLIDFQQHKVDQFSLYTKIAALLKNKEDSKTLSLIVQDEKNHEEIFRKYTKKNVKANKIKLYSYLLMFYIFGYTFVIKLQEKRNVFDKEKYESHLDKVEELCSIIDDEIVNHEKLINMLQEERLKYLSDIILGMNDGIVELTGALAGYTLAMQNTKMIAMAGLIIGLSATLSLSASNYLSNIESKQKNAIKSATYTGFAYLISVGLLVSPFLILNKNYYLFALLLSLIIAILIIAIFSYYLSIINKRSFSKSFKVMAFISLSVAIISFIIGIVVKNILHINF